MRSLAADAAFYGLLVLFIVLHVAINRQADNHYPTPWPTNYIMAGPEWGLD
jgi:hypothetical protein